MCLEGEQTEQLIEENRRMVRTHQLHICERVVVDIGGEERTHLIEAMSIQINIVEGVEVRVALDREAEAKG